MDARITDLIADGAGLDVFRPHLDGIFTASIHCLYIDYHGEGPTVEAALAALAEDITILREGRAIGEKVAMYADLVANGENPDVAAEIVDSV